MNPVFGYGCAGGCYGYHGGCYSGWGSYTNESFFAGCTGCYGCYGGYAGYGVPVPLQPLNLKDQRVGEPYPAVNPDAKKKDKGPGGEEVAPPKEKKKETKDGKEARGTIKMMIPDGAKLFVDGRPIEVTPGTRIFRTPILTPGQAYYYDVRIEITRDGAVIADERRVNVRPGEETAPVFENIPPPAVNTAAATR